MTAFIKQGGPAYNAPPLARRPEKLAAPIRLSITVCDNRTTPLSDDRGLLNLLVSIGLVPVFHQPLEDLMTEELELAGAGSAVRGDDSFPSPGPDHLI